MPKVQRISRLARRKTRPAVRAVPTIVRPSQFIGRLIRRAARRVGPIVRR